MRDPTLRVVPVVAGSRKVLDPAYDARVPIAATDYRTGVTPGGIVPYPQRQKPDREDRMTHHLLRALVLLTAVAFVSAASAADNIRVGKAVPFAWTFTPIDVGIETGLFAKQGLELTVTGFAGDARVQQALVSDSIDFGLGSGAGMGFLAKRVPAKAVAAMAGAPMNMSLVVSYDSPIKSLDQIKGKKIGITTVGSL